MTLSQYEIRSLQPESSPYKKGLGDGLLIFVERTYKGKEGEVKGGGKYFRGKFKGKEIQIGVLGNASGEYCLKSARKKWDEIKDWCISNKKDVTDYKTISKTNTNIQKTLNDAIDGFLNDAIDLKKTTHKEYTRQLKKVVLSRIDGNTPLKELEWDKGGATIEEVIDAIADGKKWDAADRCRQLLCQVFDYAIRKKWMSRNQNPAKIDGKDRKRHQQKNHPSIKWEEVPELLKEINLNRCNSHIQSVLATKLMLMTFLRTGALVRLKWEWIDQDKKLLTIDGRTSGLKRRKGVNDDVPHHIPITKEMGKIFDRCAQLNNGEEYIFLPMRESRYPFLDPSSPNNYLRNLGYKNKQRAHGWRKIARTVSVDVLGCDGDVIKRQMGHLPDNKVDRAYDKSLRLNDRRDFLEKWCSLLVETGLEI